MNGAFDTFGYSLQQCLKINLDCSLNSYFFKWWDIQLFDGYVAVVVTGNGSAGLL